VLKYSIRTYQATLNTSNQPTDSFLAAATPSEIRTSSVFAGFNLDPDNVGCL
jgi:hypothetical protein